MGSPEGAHPAPIGGRRLAKEGPRARPFESREPLHPHFLTRRGGALRGVFPARWPSADEELFTMATRVKRIMTQPINLIFRFLQSKTRVQIWIYEMTDLKIEGVIVVSCRIGAFRGNPSVASKGEPAGRLVLHVQKTTARANTRTRSLPTSPALSLSLLLALARTSARGSMST